MRPKVCSGFVCEWLRGAGREKDRPDKSGVMISINELNGGMWIFVVELEENAARMRGKQAIMAVASRVDLPVIISSYGEEAPNDFGSYTIVKDTLLPRARQLIGKRRGFLDADKKFGVYDLVVN